MKAYLKWILMRVKCQKLGLKYISSSAYIAKGRQSIHRSLKMDSFSYLGPESIIGPNVTLGAYAMVGPRVSFVGDDHVFNVIGNPTIFSGRPPEVRATQVGKDAWLGCGSVILAGCQIGDASIVAAGSVVTKDVPSGVIVGGVPAVIIRRRFGNENELEKHMKAISSKQIKKGGHYVAPSSNFNL